MASVYVVSTSKNANIFKALDVCVNIVSKEEAIDKVKEIIHNDARIIILCKEVYDLTFDLRKKIEGNLYPVFCLLPFNLEELEKQNYTKNLFSDILGNS